MPQCLTSVLGRGLLGSLRAILQLGAPKETLILTLKTDKPEEQILFLAIFYKQ